MRVVGVQGSGGGRSQGSGFRTQDSGLSPATPRLAGKNACCSGERPTVAGLFERSGPRAWKRGFVALLIPVLLAVAGCGTSELQSEYGKRNGPGVFASVNGTAVFADMCEARGHTVFSWPTLSPRIRDRADCIVWFPDSYDPPEREVQAWLERWLHAKPGRTLIYVGRHYDAESWYWESVESAPIPVEMAKEIGRRRKEARRRFGDALKPLAPSTDHDWFVLDGRHRNRKITTLEGSPEWLDGVDPSKVAMELNTRMEAPANAEVLLASEGDPIVFREALFGSRLIVVANGSFLLNAPLANHENRRLAGKLIDELGPPEKTIAFLEFSPLKPKISEKDPSFGPRLGFEVFQVWPTNWILLHVCLLAILLCFWRYPIFGRPVEPEAESTSDFGLHIDAVARLLARTGDTAYAHTRLRHYRQTARPDIASKVSGSETIASHDASVPPPRPSPPDDPLDGDETPADAPLSEGESPS